MVSLLLAITLALLAFPEVVVLGGSLSSTGMNQLLTPTAEPETVRTYPTWDASPTPVSATSVRACGSSSRPPSS